LSTLKITDRVVTEGLGLAGPMDFFELKDPAFASGAFGEIYFAAGCNGLRFAEGLAVKVFFEGDRSRELLRNVRDLQSVLNDYSRSPNGTSRPITRMPALRCLPALSFKGQLKGKNVQGYAAHYIPQSKAKTLDQLLDELYDPDPSRQTLRFTTPYQRLRLAQQLVEGMEFLRDRSYIHADLNAQNLLIDFKHGNLHIIDFDAGVVTGKTGDETETWGKRDEWTAPEVMYQTGSDANDRVAVSLASDVWSTAVGIHYLLTLAYPFYFLANLERRTVIEYQTRFKWPHIEVTDSLFAQGEPTRKRLAKLFRDNPEINDALLRYFVVTFQDGFFDRSRRTGYGQWNQKLTTLLLARPGSAVWNLNPPRPSPPPPQPPPPPPPPPPSGPSSNTGKGTTHRSAVQARLRPAATAQQRWRPVFMALKGLGNLILLAAASIIGLFQLVQAVIVGLASAAGWIARGIGLAWEALGLFLGWLFEIGKGVAVIAAIGFVAYLVLGKDHSSSQPARSTTEALNTPAQVTPRSEKTEPKHRVQRKAPPRDLLQQEARSSATVPDTSPQPARTPAPALSPSPSLTPFLSVTRPPDPQPAPAPSPVPAPPPVDPLQVSRAHCHVVRFFRRILSPDRMQVIVESWNQGAAGRVQVDASIGLLHRTQLIDATGNGRNTTVLNFDVEPNVVMADPTVICIPQ
jgi:hypothetical protein